MSLSSASIAVRSSGSVSRPLIPGRESPTATRGTHARSRTPIVYPALLSRVAAVFRERLPLSDRVKDGLTYKDCFDGREAVDKIAYIIKTTDRNLALLLGRALDAQKFFHDVTYDHRLRDSPAELYQFRMSVASPFVSGELAAQGGQDVPPRPPSKHDSFAGASVKSQQSSAMLSDIASPPTTGPHPATLVSQTLVEEPARKETTSSTSDEVPLPSGVFTLLTDCYSPTCTRDQLCYSIACPRRLEQQSRLNMKPQPGLKKQISRESLGDLVVRILQARPPPHVSSDKHEPQGTGNTLDTFSATRDCEQRF